MSKGRFSLGLVIGALTGLVAGILSAPKSGKETRDELKKKAEDIKDKAVDFKKDTEDKAKSLRKGAEEVAKDVKSALKK